MVQYLHFRILKFPLIITVHIVNQPKVCRISPINRILSSASRRSLSLIRILEIFFAELMANLSVS